MRGVPAPDGYLQGARGECGPGELAAGGGESQPGGATPAAEFLIAVNLRDFVLMYGEAPLR
jgi:hypothetical protein